jgi:hypothetical protein
VIAGKLMAWAEGWSRKHETDIYEMMVFHYPSADPTLSARLDEPYVDAQARALGGEVVELWKTVKDAALREASQARSQF